jgi:hypothetical protein
MNGHGTFPTGAANDLNEVSDFMFIHDDDNADEAFSPRRGYSTNNNTAALTSTDAHPTKEPLLVSSLNSHSLQEPLDSRSLKTTDLSCLIEWNANFNETQRTQLFSVLINPLAYTAVWQPAAHFKSIITLPAVRRTEQL